MFRILFHLATSFLSLFFFVGSYNVGDLMQPSTPQTLLCVPCAISSQRTTELLPNLQDVCSSHAKPHEYFSNALRIVTKFFLFTGKTVLSSPSPSTSVSSGFGVSLHSSFFRFQALLQLCNFKYSLTFGLMLSFSNHCDPEHLP